jgi:hypothetical protein
MRYLCHLTVHSKGQQSPNYRSISAEGTGLGCLRMKACQAFQKHSMLTDASLPLYMQYTKAKAARTPESSGTSPAGLPVSSASSGRLRLIFSSKQFSNESEDSKVIISSALPEKALSFIVLRLQGGTPPDSKCTKVYMSRVVSLSDRSFVLNSNGYLQPYR